MPHRSHTNKLPMFLILSVTVFAINVGAQQFTIEDFKLTPQEELAKTFAKKGSPSGGMWFGPRLGKRSHHAPNFGIPLQRLLMEAIADSRRIEDYADLKPSSANTKRRFTPRLGRESGEEQGTRNVDFIPRLGRELDPRILAQLLTSEEFPCSDTELFGRALSDSYEPKIPPFTPRLGRENMANFYDQNLDLSALKENGMRIARSAPVPKHGDNVAN